MRRINKLQGMMLLAAAWIVGPAAGFAGGAVQAQMPGMTPPQVFAWSDSSLSPDARADLVIKEMTLDEKLALLHGHGMALFGPPPAGSNGGAGFTDAIPRLGIPAIQMADSAYGVTMGAASGRYSTALPSNLGAASSWDPELVYKYGALIGKELRDQGYGMSLGGGVNLTREPRNGRTFEYQGEDPLLAGTLAGNFARGVQSEHIIGDIKHYALNDQESGRYAYDAIIDKRSMRETDLRAFEIALAISGAQAVMCAYNRVNGDFACENSYLLNDVLRRDFHFKGFVVSDWGATHSTAKASHAGLDMEQPSTIFYGDALKNAVQSGAVTEAELNEHALRVLRAIFASGLFDNQVKKQVPDVERGYRVAQETEEKSIVLLKNAQHALPLEAGKVKKVVVIGGHADAGVLTGGGSAQVNAPGGTVVQPPPPTSLWDFFLKPEWLPGAPLEAIQAAMPGAKVEFVSGADVDAAVSAAKSADAAIVFAYQWESENFDLATLALSADQNKLIDAVATVNPRTIAVLETGGPVTMPWMEKTAAVVEAWYPGIRGAQAIARVLTGEVNPTGKLAVTFPLSDADLPHPALAKPPKESDIDPAAAVMDLQGMMKKMAQGLPPYPVHYDEKLKVGYAWYDAEKKNVLFPFGFGLSYTEYAYSDLKVEKGDGLKIEFKVKNTGKRAGTEIAEVYAALPASADEPPKRLAGWAKVDLQSGEEKTVSIEVPRDRLTIYDEASDQWKLPAGEYTILAGKSSRDLPLKQTITLQ